MSTLQNQVAGDQCDFQVFQSGLESDTLCYVNQEKATCSLRRVRSRNVSFQKKLVTRPRMGIRKPNRHARKDRHKTKIALKHAFQLDWCENGHHEGPEDESHQGIQVDRGFILLETIPLLQKMRPRGRYVRYTDLNEYFAPLKKFLQTRVGSKWDKVYSEICSRVHLGSAVSEHILQHLSDFVFFSHDQSLLDYIFLFDYYVDNEGFLRKVSDLLIKVETPVRSTSPDFFIDKGGALRIRRETDNLWFQVVWVPYRPYARRRRCGLFGGGFRGLPESIKEFLGSPRKGIPSFNLRGRYLVVKHSKGKESVFPVLRSASAP
ncbi:MAG: hypothetical protein CL685_01290 [Candidatus Magasanikbacteria bacterium]|nr:hypothetical protein [Candidatus Magasanikbacteria bacterium]